MFGRAATDTRNLHSLEQVETWTRETFGLTADCLVLVSEEAGRLPGFPPLLTVVLFWTPDGTRHRLTLFKPVAGVVAGDMPIHWLRPSLVDDAGDCC
ncbi:MAG: hypothetical protein P8N72_15160 [Flavimaricola sp.]|nr:hypothetical protein [Flavimaricola sp.]